MDADQTRVMRVLAAAEGPLLAREVAAIAFGCSVQEAVQSGRSVEVARILGGLSASGHVKKSYPPGISYTAYEISGLITIST